MARLTAPNGTTVNVSDDKVDGLKLRGFTADSGSKTATKRKTSTKKSASSDTSDK